MRSLPFSSMVPWLCLSKFGGAFYVPIVLVGLILTFSCFLWAGIYTSLELYSHMRASSLSLCAAGSRLGDCFSATVILFAGLTWWGFKTWRPAVRLLLISFPSSEVSVEVSQVVRSWYSYDGFHVSIFFFRTMSFVDCYVTTACAAVGERIESPGCVDESF